MAIYLKKFSTNAEYETYISGSGAILPNVSLTVDNNEVHYNPSTPVPPTPTETRLVAKCYVESEGSSIMLFYREGGSGSGSGSGSGGEVPFSSMEIDGVEQEVVNQYTFNTTGEHTVKYTLVDPTSIGNKAFYSCSNLTSITIPNRVTSIGNTAFAYCDGLTSIVIPDSVTSIGDEAFEYCNGLTSITIPNSVTSIGNNTFRYCIGLTRVTIGNSVTSIGWSSFEGCSSLTSIVIPNSVTSIGSNAFMNCYGLTSITIPNSVTSIGYEAFEYCNGLTSIVIPDSVTSIGNEAFENCSSLTSIICNAATAPSIQSRTFYGIKENGTLTVTSGSTGYDVWMGTGNYYLGLYNWTKVEQ